MLQSCSRAGLVYFAHSTLLVVEIEKDTFLKYVSCFNTNNTYLHLLN